jgi:uncharacterized peroxidase-related enzyme
MAFISYADEKPLDPTLDGLYKQYGDPQTGDPANVVRIHSHNPPVLESHMALSRTLLHGPSALSRTQREMIAVAVSQANECHYGLQHHGAALRQLLEDDALVVRLESDYRGTDLPPADRAMLDYCVKLTLTPNKITRADVDALRRHGFTDAAIHDICTVAAYAIFANRMMAGLGIELEDYWSK